ncbi:iron ABC transporter permease [Gangjinia marincola]|uniref:Iron ABC transporter permease n=1 Tax=Gangjinia marincola TaxID=578463 RepID=A0ABN1MFN8_9FLAO
MKKTSTYIVFGILLLVASALLNLSLGSVKIPLKEILNIIGFGESSKEAWNYIILDYRIPKMFTAILVGSGLGVSGLLMQTLFKNPLAGPYVLGLSSGASLGVALVIMGAGLFGVFLGAFILSPWTIVIAASLGSMLLLMAILIASARLTDTMAILIIGLMFASLTGAVVSVLSYMSPAAQLQQYVFWSLGSLGDLTYKELAVLSLFWGLGMLLSVAGAKGLNALLLGDWYARSLGLKLKQNRFIVMIATACMAGSITTFAGPIAFVGLAVPHLVRQITPSNNHFGLIPLVALGGAIVMLLCDSIAQLPGSDYTLPINAVTSIFGAPVVIWLLVRRKRLIF